MASKYLTKPGAYGTLYRYRYSYQDIDGDGPVWKCQGWYYSAEHVRDAFYSSETSDGWEIKSIERVTL